VAAEEALMEQTESDPTTEAALRSLHDIAVPEPISWLPHTWGWAVLVGALLIVLALASLRGILRYRANAYRREALYLLEGIEPRIRNYDTRAEAIREVARILKRTALAAWNRGQVAALSEKDWASFLDQKGEARGGRVLGELTDDFEYRNDEWMKRLPGNLANELTRDARRWIERHHV
jgi:hypothetical protein